MEPSLEDIQTRLITSEQQRIKLEQELRTLMAQSNRSERLRAMQLKSQLEKLQSQRQKSVQRNQMIRRQMTEFDANLINVSATTQRLRALKDEYEAYVERLYPQWKEKVISEAIESRDKEMRLSAMTRDIDIDAEIKAKSAYKHDSLSEIFNQPNTDSSHSAYHRAPSDIRQSYPRSATPSPHRASTPDIVVTGYGVKGEAGQRDPKIPASLISEKSVTFDATSLQNGSSTNRDLDLMDKSGNTLAQTNGDSKDRSASGRLRRSSPSELLRMSRESSEASLRASAEFLPSLTSLQDKPPTSAARLTAPHSQPASYSQTAGLSQSSPLEYGSAKQMTHGQLPTNQGVHTPSNQHQVTGLQSNQTIADQKTSSSMTNLVTSSPSNQSPYHSALAATESYDAQNLAMSSQRRSSTSPRVVIPSAHDTASGDDDDDDLPDDINDILDNPSAAPSHQPSSTIQLAPASHSQSSAASAVLVNQSLSSLNTTAEEEEKTPGVDITKTAEFRNLLAGSLPRAKHDAEESDSSEDSIEAVEKAYKQLSLSKTNTMPVGHDLAPSEPNAPSTEEEEEKSDSLSAPMGYTPSFATTAPITADVPAAELRHKLNSTAPTSSNAASGGAGKTAVLGISSTPGSTGGSSSRGSSKRPAYLRTDSDIDSESGPDVAEKKNDDDLDDDFDFYG